MSFSQALSHSPSSALHRVLPSRQIILCLTSLLGLAACLRVVAFRGPIGADDLFYAELAHQLADGRSFVLTYNGPPAFAVRIGIIAPTALAFRLFGIRDAAIAFYPFVLSLAGILLAFIAGCMLFNQRAGLIAALLQALMPIDISSATLLLPDLPAAFWVNVAILLLYIGSQQQGNERKARLGLLAGLALGSSWLCKEALLFSLPFVGLYMVWCMYGQRRNWILAAALVLGFACVLAAESAAYYVASGDVLYRFSAIERHNRYPTAVVWFWKPSASWSDLLARLLRDGPAAILLNTQLGLLPPIAGLAAAYPLFRKCPAATFVSLWFLYHAFIFNFG